MPKSVCPEVTERYKKIFLEGATQVLQPLSEQLRNNPRILVEDCQYELS